MIVTFFTYSNFNKKKKKKNHPSKETEKLQL